MDHDTNLHIDHFDNSNTLVANGRDFDTYLRDLIFFLVRPFSVLDLTPVPSPLGEGELVLLIAKCYAIPHARRVEELLRLVLFDV